MDLDGKVAIVTGSPAGGLGHRWRSLRLAPAPARPARRWW